MDEFGLIYNVALQEYVYENSHEGGQPGVLSSGGGQVALPPPPTSITHRQKSNKPELPQSPTSHHTLYHAEGGSTNPSLPFSTYTYPTYTYPTYTYPSPSQSQSPTELYPTLTDLTLT